MNSRALGILHKVSYQSLADFPHDWLAHWLDDRENVDYLGSMLGMELTQSRAPLPVRDSAIVQLACKKTGVPVLLYGGIGALSDAQIGGLLINISRTDAALLVWVAETISQDAIDVVQWLNKITADPFNFFAMRAEFWRIADSPVAPNFYMATAPANWKAPERKSGNVGEGVAFPAAKTSAPAKPEVATKVNTAAKAEIGPKTEITAKTDVPAPAQVVVQPETVANKTSTKHDESSLPIKTPPSSVRAEIETPVATKRNPNPETSPAISGAPPQAIEKTAETIAEKPVEKPVEAEFAPETRPFERWRKLMNEPEQRTAAPKSRADAAPEIKLPVVEPAPVASTEKTKPAVDKIPPVVITETRAEPEKRPSFLSSMFKKNRSDSELFRMDAGPADKLFPAKSGERRESASSPDWFKNKDERDKTIARYWQGLNDLVAQRNGNLQPTLAFPQEWITFPTEHPDYLLVARVNPEGRNLSVKLKLTGAQGEVDFYTLRQLSNVIETELEAQVTWHEDAAAGEHALVVDHENIDLSKPDDWTAGQSWMADTLENFYQMVSRYFVFN